MARRADFAKLIAQQKFCLPQRNSPAWSYWPHAGKHATIFLKKSIMAEPAFAPCATPNWTNCQYKKIPHMLRAVMLGAAAACPQNCQILLTAKSNRRRDNGNMAKSWPGDASRN
jgi:hypothetical protein